LKDTHYQIHTFVLKNPKITSDEVAHIARMATVTGDMIKAIVQNNEWMSNAAVRLAIVKNPKTPLPIVEKHLPKVNELDLMQIAKSDGVRESVSRLAMKILQSRGKTVR